MAGAAGADLRPGLRARLKTVAVEKRKVVNAAQLDKLTSPEGLDALMTVTHPRSWLAIASIGLVLVAGLAWGILGRIPYTVRGKGIFIFEGGIYNVVALGGGQTAEVRVKVGDTVRKNQVIARILQPDLELRLRQAKTALETGKSKAGTLTPIGDRGRAMQLKQLENDDRFLKQKVDALTKQLELLSSFAEASKRAAAEGVISRSDLVRAQQNYLASESDLADARSRLEENHLKRLQLTQDKSTTSFATRQSLEDLEHQVQALEASLDEAENVKSPHYGRVTELLVLPGDVVATGQPLVKVEPLDVPPTVVIYVPVSDGKRAHPGMEAHVEPFNVKKEESGYLVGQVKRVSEYPASRAAMIDLLSDPDLVSFFTAEGPTTAMEVTLERDASNPTGYRWSSGRNGGVRLTHGTLCNAEIVTRQEAPIRMVIPAVKKTLGL